ncbi:MAG: hypothetical protein AAFW59_10365, partial [Pseudomonadota bacterium]
VELSCFFGVPTQTNDTFPSSVGATELSIAGGARVIGGADSGTYDLSSTTASLSGNPNDGDVTISITIGGTRLSGLAGQPQPEINFGTFDGSGSVSITDTSFGGSLASNDLSGVVANFEGWFFGPQALETGITFSADGVRTDGSRVIVTGTILAR